MGCGVSNSSVNDIQHPVSNVVNKPTLPSSHQLEKKEENEEHETIKHQTLPTMSAETMNVLISCHSDQQNLAEQLKKSLINKNYACYIANETDPQSIVARANLVRWCDVCIVLISRMYQQASSCMEMIYYTKDLRQPIIAILTEGNFQPYGGLGAVVASACQSILLRNDGISGNTVTQVANAIPKEKNKKKQTKNVLDPTTAEKESKNVNIVDGNHSCNILICTVDDGATIGQLIYDEFMTKNLNVGIENLSNGNAVSSVRQCTVLVPILSPQFEQSAICRRVFEEARRLRKPIVPVMAVQGWKPEDWVALTIAGTIYFRIFDKETAYKPFFDTNPMTDLCVSVEIACQPVPSQAEREQVEIKVIKEEIEECKKKLQTWPPIRKPRVKNPMADRQPVRVTIEEPNARLKFTHIHHSITRMDMKAPPTLLDKYGLPKRQDLDCMISYQWDNQDFVRTIYEDMSMREIRTWFDIWGSMQGNTNEAMATGVECARVLLVFLSKAYVNSINCQLEFRYAVKRGKAFVIIRTEPNIPLNQRMLEAIEGFPQYNIYSYEQLEAPINGVPTIDVILQSVRKLAQAQPADIIDDCSAELFELRSLLDDARDAVSNESGQARFKTCTRCNQQFDEYTKGGCTKHRSYYMGGTILEGRWMCCRQQQKDSPGCESCDHTDVARVFTQDPSYGTWTWQPS